MTSTRFAVVMTTVGSEKEAKSIAHSLVDEKLAACVNIVGPVRSIYRWHNRVENAREYLLLIKTRKDIYPQVERALVSLHSYEVPEVASLSIQTASEAYLEWLTKETKGTVRRGPKRGGC
jgi:periplasmic divalent cation tolerance protein